MLWAMAAVVRPPDAPEKPPAEVVARDMVDCGCY